MTGFIKIDQEPRFYLAAKATDAGIQNVMFADIRTVADAEQCVQAVRAETPTTGGLRGSSATRDVGILLETGSSAFIQAQEDSVVALMIEKKEAVENFDAILSVKGIDMVHFGPADYAMSAGLVGQRDTTAMREAEDFIIEIALKKGITYRADFQEPKQAERYLNLGVRHFCMAWDFRILYEWLKENGAVMRDMVKGL